MPHTWSIALRPVVASLALLVVALIVVCAPAPAEAKRTRSVPPPPAVELERTLVALGHLDPEIAANVRALRRVEARLDAIDERLAALDGERVAAAVRLAAARADLAVGVVQAAATGNDALAAALLESAAPVDARAAELVDPAGAEARAAAEHVDALALERRGLLAVRAALLRDRGYARDLIATDRAARRVVLRALPLDLRQAALRRAARGDRAERRGTGVASPLVALATGRAGLPALPRAVRSEPSGIGAVALAYALTQVGTPYRSAGESPGGFDCSGLLWWAFGQAGLEIPRSSSDIYDDALRIPRRQAAPGDIVSFHGEGHVGLYLGGGLYVHSTRTGDVVRVSPLWDRSDLDGFVRIAA
jgi:cell wall-associated NlpC family hydrolase